MYCLAKWNLILSATCYIVPNVENHIDAHIYIHVHLDTLFQKAYVDCYTTLYLKGCEFHRTLQRSKDQGTLY